MPDFDFDAFNHEYEEGEGQEGGYTHAAPAAAAPEAPVVSEPTAPVQEEAPAPQAPRPDVSAGDNLSTEEVDKW